MWRNPAYTPIRRLAYGYQSEIWVAKETSTKNIVVIKATNLDHLESFKSLQYLRDEQRCLETLGREIDSDNRSNYYKYNVSALRIVRLLHVFHEQHHVAGLEGQAQGTTYFVLNLIRGATLNKHIAKENGLSEERVRFHTAELIRVLGALHERGFVYRDLKASNIIVEPTGRIILIDFGFAKYIGSRGRTRSVCGTLHAMPPEILLRDRTESFESFAAFQQEVPKTVPYIEANLQKRPTAASVSSPSLCSTKPLFRDNYGMEVDWWSLGILVYEMIYCRPPFGYRDGSIQPNKTIKDLAQDSPSTLIFPETPCISNNLKDFLQQLLQADYTKRLGYKGDALNVQNHSWFDGFEWTLLENSTAHGPSVYQFDEGEDFKTLPNRKGQL